MHIGSTIKREFLSAYLTSANRIKILEERERNCREECLETLGGDIAEKVARYYGMTTPIREEIASLKRRMEIIEKALERVTSNTFKHKVRKRYFEGNLNIRIQSDLSKLRITEKEARTVLRR